MWPELDPEPVLRTLMALWEFEAGVFNLVKHDVLDYGGGTYTKLLRHPSCPPPPPPCQLDGVEYELDTTTIFDRTMSNNAQANMTRNEEDEIEHNTSINPLSHANATNKYPFPDLVPEAFENRVQHKVLSDSCKSGDFDRENNESTTRNIETFFLTTMLCSTLLLLYLLPAYDPLTNY